MYSGGREGSDGPGLRGASVVDGPSRVTQARASAKTQSNGAEHGAKVQQLALVWPRGIYRYLMVLVVDQPAHWREHSVRVGTRDNKEAVGHCENNEDITLVIVHICVQYALPTGRSVGHTMMMELNG